MLTVDNRVRAGVEVSDTAIIDRAIDYARVGLRANNNPRNQLR